MRKGTGRGNSVSKHTEVKEYGAHSRGDALEHAGWKVKKKEV